jgi:hypothetical protein
VRPGDNIKCSIICTRYSRRGREKEKWDRKVFEGIMA